MVIERRYVMSRILTVSIALCYAFTVLVTAGHLHDDLKVKSKCILCKLSKTISATDSGDPVTQVDRVVIVPVPAGCDQAHKPPQLTPCYHYSPRAPPRNSCLA